jgi:hypothetical protein
MLLMPRMENGNSDSDSESIFVPASVIAGFHWKNPITIEKGGTGVNAQIRDAKNMLEDILKYPTLPDEKRNPAADMLQDILKSQDTQIVIRVQLAGRNQTYEDSSGRIIVDSNPWSKGTVLQGNGWVAAPAGEPTLVHELFHVHAIQTNTVSQNVFANEALAESMANWQRVAMGIAQTNSYTGYFGADLGVRTIPVLPHSGYQ